MQISNRNTDTKKEKVIISPILKNSILNIANTGLNVFFPLIISLYSSRILLADGVGRVAYAQSIAYYFIALSTLGMPTYGLRETARFRNDQKHLSKLFSELFFLNVLTSLLASAAYLLLLINIKVFQEDILLYLSCGLPIFLNIFNVDWFFQGKEKFGYITVRNMLFKVFSLLLIVLFVRTRDDYIKYALIHNLAICGNYIVNILQVHRYVKLTVRGIRIQKHLVPLAVFAMSSFLSTIYSKIDITMLGVMTTDEIVGYYDYSHKIVDIVTSCCIAGCSVFLPRLSFYYREDRKKFTQLLEKGVRVLSFFLFPAAMGICILAPWYIELLFGRSFSPAAPALRLFSAIIIIKGLGDLVSYQTVICTGNEKKRLPSHMMAMIANIFMNAILIPHFAEKGAVIASITSLLIVNGYQYWQMRKIIEIPIDKRAVVQAVLSSLIMGGILLLTLHWKLPVPWQCICSTMAGFLAYIVINALIGNTLLNELVRIFKRRVGLL